jgi:RNA polymerase sigma-70 factor (ECF subfamily)
VDGGRLPDGGLFATLMVRHDRRLLRYIRSLLPHRADAEEVLQRTAAVLWEHFAEYDPARDFFPWAVRFAYFEVLNHRKERARDRLVFREEVLAELAATRMEMDGLLDRRRDALHECLNQVVPKDLELLRRRYAAPETIAGLATDLGTTAKSLYRRLDRLRDRLAECVERRMARMAAEEG